MLFAEAVIGPQLTGELSSLRGLILDSLFFSRQCLIALPYS